MAEVRKELIKPLTKTTGAFWALLVLLLAGTGAWLYAWYVQLSSGLVVTGLRDIGVSVPWGLYITNFIFFIGITHAGIAIASAIRILKLKEYIPLARMAELVTIFSLMVAALSIVFDLGRPDRVLNLIIYYWERVWQSPLIWDITAITTYLIYAITYLYIEMREDLIRLRGTVGGWREKLYGFLTPLYREGERDKVRKIVWWASIFNFPVMVMVHTTVAWIFGLMPSRPGWYSAIMGPYYVAGAVYSGVSAVLVVAAVYERVFKWKGMFKLSVFRSVNNFLAAVGAIYLYFLLSEHITIRFHGTVPEFEFSQALMMKEFAALFWTQIALLFVAFAVFFVQAVHSEAFSVGRTVLACAAVVVTLWITRFLIVVPPLTRSLLPYMVGVYVPTWVEVALVLGTFTNVALLFLLFTKVFPIIPITELEEAGG